jgi:transcription initiation factor IIE alpha subunit
MCIKIYYQYECGCTSIYVNEIGKCNHFQEIERLRRERPPGYEVQIDICSFNCGRASFETATSVNKWCPACTRDVQATAEEAAKNRDKDALAYYDNQGADGGASSFQG